MKELKSNEELRKEREAWRQKVIKIIESYDVEVCFGDFNYWNSVPYIKIKEGKQLWLADTYYAYGSMGIRTIFDYKTIKTIKNKVEYMLDNKCDMEVK